MNGKLSAHFSVNMTFLKKKCYNEHIFIIILSQEVIQNEMGRSQETLSRTICKI